MTESKLSKISKVRETRKISVIVTRK